MEGSNAYFFCPSCHYITTIDQIIHQCTRFYPLISPLSLISVIFCSWFRKETKEKHMRGGDAPPGPRLASPLRPKSMGISAPPSPLALALKV